MTYTLMAVVCDSPAHSRVRTLETLVRGRSPEHVRCRLCGVGHGVDDSRWQPSCVFVNKQRHLRRMTAQRVGVADDKGTRLLHSFAISQFGATDIEGFEHEGSTPDTDGSGTRSALQCAWCRGPRVEARGERLFSALDRIATTLDKPWTLESLSGAQWTEDAPRTAPHQMWAKLGWVDLGGLDELGPGRPVDVSFGAVSLTQLQAVLSVSRK